MTATGLRPAFLYKFEKRGISLPDEMFIVPGAELPDFARAGAR
jgi:hypothetical protein